MADGVRRLALRRLGGYFGGSLLPVAAVPRGVLVLGTVALLISGCSPSPEIVGEAVPSREEIQTHLPAMPSRDGTEPPVWAQFEERRALVNRVLADPGATNADVAWALGQLGRLYQAYRFVDQAVWCLDMAHSLDPQSFDWAYLLGQIHLVLGDGAAAQTFLERAAALRPREAVVYVALGQIEREAGRLDAARAHYAAALNIDPQRVLARYGMALVELDGGHAADALEMLRRLLEEQPKAYQLHYAMARALQQLGRVDEARAQLEAIPDSPIQRVGLRGSDPWVQGIQELTISSTSQERRGRQALIAGQFKVAARYLEKARDIAPERREIRFNLAMAYTGQGRDDAALDLLDGVMQDFPDYSPSYRLKGKTLERQGRVEEGRRLLERAVELDPSSEANQRALGDLLLDLGELEPAAACFEAAVSAQARSMPAYLGLVRSHLLAKRWQAAANAIERGLEQRPGERSLRWLGLRLEAAGLASLPRDLEMPGSPRGVFELESAAMIWWAQGDLDKAVHLQEGALLLAERADSAHLKTVRQRLEIYTEAGQSSNGSRGSVGLPWVVGERVQGVPAGVATAGG